MKPSSRNQGLLTILVIPLMLLACTSTARTPAVPVDTPLGGGGGLIAYSSRSMLAEVPIFSIYLLDPASGSQVNLTGTEGIMIDPAWSPDGEQIVYSSCTEQSCDLLLLDVTSREIVPLTENSGFDRHPSWSPDGEQIVFQRALPDEGWTLCLLDLDHKDVVTLVSGPGDDYEPDWSPEGEHIVFVSTRDGDEELYTIRSDGSHLIRLTRTVELERGPAWSPDGSRIVYARASETQADIFILDSDGSNPVQLMDDVPWDGDPDWSPDGMNILFSSNRDGNNYEKVYIMNVDGTNIRRLTNDPERADLMAVWQPGGENAAVITPQENELPEHLAPQRLIFVSDRSGDAEIYAINADGSGLTNLTNNPAMDSYPAWSPDGRHIAFLSNRDGQRGVYIMNSDGSDPRFLADAANSTNTDIAWSPDGTRLAFPVDLTSYQDIFVINLDGSGGMNITNAPANYLNLSWSPDGARIVFISRTMEHPDWVIFSIMPDGSGLTALTDGGATGPLWSPDGARIVYTYDHDIFVMNADGSNKFRLTDDPARDDNTFWSPDGAQIGFISRRTGQDELFLINIDGSNLRQLTTISVSGTGQDEGSSWSPDGLRLVFMSTQNENRDIYIIGVDGSGLTRLTDDPELDILPSWQPAGSAGPPAGLEESPTEPGVESTGSNSPASGSTGLPAGLEQPGSSPLWWLIPVLLLLAGLLIYVRKPILAALRTERRHILIHRQGNRETHITLHDGFTIGSEAGCDLVLDEAGVEAKHARLRFSDGRWLIASPGGLQNIGLRGQLVDAAVLQPGDALQLGQARLEFRVEKGPQEGTGKEIAGAGPAGAIRDGDARLGNTLAGWFNGLGKLRWSVLTDWFKRLGKWSWVLLAGIVLLSLILFWPRDRHPAPEPTATENAAIPTEPPMATEPPAPDFSTLADQIAFTYWDGNTSWIYLMNSDGSDRRPLVGGDGPSYSHPIWSPDGTRLAYLRGSDLIVMSGFHGSENATVQLTSGMAVENPLWSPDGTQIAFVSGNQIYRVDTRTGSQLLLIQEGVWPAEFSWSPDSTKLAVVYQNPNYGWLNLRIVDVNGSVLVTKVGNLNHHTPAWSPGGDSIVYYNEVDLNQLVQYFPEANSTFHLGDSPELCAGRDTSPNPSWSPDGRFLVYYCRGIIYVLDMVSLEPRSIFVNENTYYGTNALEDVVWSPDGEWILFRIFDEVDMGIYRVRPDGSDLLRLSPEDGYDSEPAWQPGVSSGMP